MSIMTLHSEDTISCGKSLNAALNMREHFTLEPCKSFYCPLTLSSYSHIRVHDNEQNTKTSKTPRQVEYHQYGKYTY
jgi:hypothetical protein